MNSRKCKNCDVPIGYEGSNYCADCIRAYLSGSFHSLGGLLTSVVIGYVLKWIGLWLLP